MTAGGQDHEQPAGTIARRRTSPEVSVVIPTVRGGRLLAEAVRSALGQTLDDVEVLVVTNASGVDLALLPADPRIRVLHQPRGGKPWAVNLAVGEARGRWLAFLDDDDLWEPEKLELQLAALEGWRGVPACTSQFRLIDEDGALTGDGWGRPMTYRELLGARGRFLWSTLVVARSRWVLLGGLDPRVRYAEDLAFVLRLLADGPCAFVDTPLVRYRRHRGAITRDHALELVQWHSLVVAAERRLAARAGDWGSWAASLRGSVLARRWTTSEAFAEADRSFRQGSYRRAAGLARVGLAASPPDAVRLLLKRAAGRI